jgi:hypothetical protein
VEDRLGRWDAVSLRKILGDRKRVPWFMVERLDAPQRHLLSAIWTTLEYAPFRGCGPRWNALKESGGYAVEMVEIEPQANMGNDIT